CCRVNPPPPLLESHPIYRLLRDSRTANGELKWQHEACSSAPLSRYLDSTMPTMLEGRHRSSIRVVRVPIRISSGDIAHQVAADRFHLLADRERGGLFEEHPGHPAQQRRDRIDDRERGFAVDDRAIAALFERQDGGEVAER